jgi:hypothetical protein
MAPTVRRIQFLWDDALKAELADSFEHFRAVAFSMFDILNAACIFAQEKNGPARAGPPGVAFRSVSKPYGTTVTASGLILNPTIGPNVGNEFLVLFNNKPMRGSSSSQTALATPPSACTPSTAARSVKSGAPLCLRRTHRRRR